MIERNPAPSGSIVRGKVSVRSRQTRQHFLVLSGLDQKRAEGNLGVDASKYAIVRRRQKDDVREAGCKRFRCPVFLEKQRKS